MMLSSPWRAHGLGCVSLACQLNLDWLWPVKLWRIRRADHDPKTMPQPQIIPISRTHMGQAEINSGGLSQEGSSQLRESERACVCSQLIYGGLSQAPSRARPFVYLAG